MTPKEWHDRFLSYLTEKGFSYDDAWDILAAGMGSYNYDEDNPEDVADEELSLWLSDG